MGNYIDESDVDAELGTDVVRAIFSDAPNGATNTTSLNAFIRNAEAIVNSYLRRVYPKIPLDAPIPDLAKFLTLEVFVGLAERRHPELVKVNGTVRFKDARAMLDQLAKGELRLDVMSTPEPAKNEGGTIRSGNPDAPTPLPKVFGNGTGFF